jgi:uncharacterized protein YkwD
MPIKRHIYAALTVILASLALAGTAGAASAAPAGPALSESERSLLRAVNGVRASYGLARLSVDPALQRAARGYSRTMLRTNQFTHGDMGARLQAQGARGPRFGENLAWGTGSWATASRIVANWMASPGHRANLLRPGWRRIGIGAVRGVFLGYAGATVVTADFAGS